MPRRPADGNVRQLQGHHRVFGRAQCGEHLLCDGVGVLQAGIADVAAIDVERVRDAADHGRRRQADLLHLKHDVLALAGGLIGGHFLHEEVFRPLLDLPVLHAWVVPQNALAT